MRRVYAAAVALIGVYAAAVLVGAAYFGSVLPDEYLFESGQPYELQGSELLSLSVSRARDSEAAALGDDFFADITFLGGRVKQVHVAENSGSRVLVSGRPFGVKMMTKGVVVVGMTPVQGEGQSISPGQKAGLKM